MKKTFIFGLMAAALVFTACSEDDLNGNNGASNSNQKGMVLRATVEQPGDTRATFTDSEEVAGAWEFAFAAGDKVSVTNDDMTTDFYTFTNEGTEFKCEEAKAAEGPVAWFAYFPSNVVSLVGQSGTKADVANKYALAGKSSATTGEEGLNITMSPKVAILVINNQIGTIDINVKSSATEWVSVLTANNNDGFNVTPSTTKQTLLSATTKGTYYIAVPAGVQLAVKDGDKTIKSTGTNGLTAGNYYNLTIAPAATTGKAKATIGGSEVDVNWVQLWENGPKFAEYNVGATSVEDYGGYYNWGKTTNKDTSGAYNNGPDALTGDDDTATKLWGSNWRLPKQTELQGLLDNCDALWTTVNDVSGSKFTGKGAYSSNSVFLPATGTFADGYVKDKGTIGIYWSSTPNYDDVKNKRACRLYFNSNLMSANDPSTLRADDGSRMVGTSVRAVLAK